MPQLPNPIALGKQAISRDQRCGLHGRKNVKPHARNHEAHGETGKTGCESADKGSSQKKYKNDAIHGVSLPQEVSGDWMAFHLEGRPRWTPASQFFRAQL